MKPYIQCGVRFENRGDSPPTKGYVDRLIRALDEAGIEACWHSALGGLGRPLYPTRLMTHVHPEAAYQPFRYLLDRLHATGRPVVSWMPLTDNEAVREEHPEWALQPLTGERDAAGPEGNWARNNHGLCPNSPCGQLLPRLAAETGATLDITTAADALPFDAVAAETLVDVGDDSAQSDGGRKCACLPARY